MVANNVLSVGCRFTGRQVAIRAGFKKGEEEEQILDATPWQAFVEPALDHYPLFRGLRYVVHVGLKIEIGFRLAPGLAVQIPEKINQYFLKNQIFCGVLRVTHKSLLNKPSTAATETIRDGFIYNADGNGRPLGKWGERFWHFLESTQKEYPVTMGVTGGVFTVEGGYDKELLPPFAQEIVDKYR